MSAYPEFHVSTGSASPVSPAAGPRVGAPAVERAH
jgi:hypothetical protein